MSNQGISQPLLYYSVTTDAKRDEKMLKHQMDHALTQNYLDECTIEDSCTHRRLFTCYRMTSPLLITIIIHELEIYFSILFNNSNYRFINTAIYFDFICELATFAKYEEI